MQYVLLCFETAGDFAAREDAAAQSGARAAHLSYLAALKAAGVAIPSLVGGAGLKAPHTATTLRRRGGARLVADGPHGDLKEALGGFYLIDVADLDAALDWAESCPTAGTGAVEVRPVLSAR